jgi:predicted esterase
MKRLVYFLLVFVFSTNITGKIFSQQYCITGRFDTTYYFNALQIDTLGNVQFGQNTDWLGSTINLKFIIAYPKISVDPLNKRPFILLIHGGGFIDGDKYDMKPVMLDFAMRGYVCASIDYRLGWQTNGDPTNCLGDGYSLSKANYRAYQDSKAALRYFAANANTYKIDTAYFFVGGISAGAVTSLMISYANQQDINSVYPSLVTELGSLDSASNTLTNRFTIKCALSSSGGVFDSAFVKANTKIPAIMFHGTLDPEVPFNTGFAYSCTNYVRTEGSNELKKRFLHLVKPFEIDYVPGGGHENYYPLPYVQYRSILFLKRYLCNNARQIIIENYTTLFDSSLGAFNGVIARNESVPAEYRLYQNYPNPFNPITIIRYQIKDSRFVTLKVYDILGREIETLVKELQNAGTYEAQFTENQISSGVYFYYLEVTEPGSQKLLFKDVKRMLLIK